MDDLFEQLKARIQALAHQCEHLKQVNGNLRQAKAELSREKDILLAKNKLAVTQIESMVSRLKSISEKSS